MSEATGMFRRTPDAVCERVGLETWPNESPGFRTLTKTRQPNGPYLFSLQLYLSQAFIEVQVFIRK